MFEDHAADLGPVLVTAKNVIPQFLESFQGRPSATIRRNRLAPTALVLAALLIDIVRAARHVAVVAERDDVPRVARPTS
jgi:hypothetical protein